MYNRTLYNAQSPHLSKLLELGDLKIKNQKSKSTCLLGVGRSLSIMVTHAERYIIEYHTRLPRPHFITPIHSIFPGKLIQKPGFFFFVLFQSLSPTSPSHNYLNPSLAHLYLRVRLAMEKLQLEPDLGDRKMALLLTLPLDLFEPVIGFLSPHSIVKLIICGNNKLISKLTNRGGVKSIRFAQVDVFCDFPVLFASFGHLQTLEYSLMEHFLPLSAVSVDTPMVTIPYFPHLRELTIYGRCGLPLESNPPKSQYVIDYGASFPKLQVLRVTVRERREEILRNLPATLHTLEFTWTQNYVPIGSEIQLPVSPNLTRLHLKGGILSHMVIPTIPPSVTDLMLSITWASKPGFLHTNIMTVSYVSTLVLSCAIIDQSYLPQIVAIPSLTSLTLLHIMRSTSLNLPWSPNITTLRLFGMSFMKQSIFKNLPSKLEILGILDSYPSILREFDNDSFNYLPHSLTDLAISLYHNPVAWKSLISGPLPPNLTRFKWNNMWYHLTTDSKTCHISNLPPNMHILDLSLPKQLAYRDPSYFFTDSLLALPSSLTVLRIPKFSNDWKCKHVKALPKTLKILEISPRNYMKPLIIALLPKSLIELILLRNNFVGDHHIENLPPNLEILKFGLAKNFSASSFSKLPANLRYLNMRGWRNFGDEVVRMLPRQLVKLWITGILPGSLTPACLEFLPRGIKTLEMNMWHHWEYNSSCFNALNHLPPSLTELIVPRGPKEWSTGAPVAPYFRRLSTLHFKRYIIDPNTWAKSIPNLYFITCYGNEFLRAERPHFPTFIEQWIFAEYDLLEPKWNTK
jgi:hypothetical protein